MYVITKKPLVYRRVLVWALRDSNPGPTDYESAALTNWAKGPYYGMCLICDQERTQIMASIYYRLDKSGNKRYYGSIYNNGKRIRKFLGCSRQSAQALIKKFEYELLLNIESLDINSQRISFEQSLHSFKKDIERTGVKVKQISVITTKVNYFKDYWNIC